MYTLTRTHTIRAPRDAVWAVLADVDRWSEWDPHEESGHIDGPFEAGTTATTKPRGAPEARWVLTEVVPGHRWASKTPLPGGNLVASGELSHEGDAVRYTRTVRVSGPLELLFRLWFGPRMARDLETTAAALEARANSAR